MRQCISSDEAVPAKGQHRKPCSDCPWSRKSLPGWLGGVSKGWWLAEVRSDARIPCHTLKGAQCAGSAIYRANTCKSSRDPEVLDLPADRKAVFASSMEFEEHHKGGPAG